MVLNASIEDYVKKEYECRSTQELNTLITSEGLLVLYVNIRGLKTNFNKLELLIECMINKPNIIICAETWNLQCLGMFDMSGYRMYYNESFVNKADGVVMYIDDSLLENTQIVLIDRINVLYSDITLNDGEVLRVSAVYRSHDIARAEFVHAINEYLKNNINIKNHCIVGDFNIDINSKNLQATDNTIRQEFLNNFLEKEYEPYFTGVTRPSGNTGGGSCIDNMFIKTHTLQIGAFNLTNPITDHYPLIAQLNKLEPKKQVKMNNKIINYKRIKNIASRMPWNIVLSMQPY